MPKVTISLIASCLLMHLADPAGDWTIYNRGQADDVWRYLTASFSHYDAPHLWTNLLAVLLLGSWIEARTSTYEMLMILGTTISASAICLHFLLSEYQTFAGISCVNYALLGYLITLRNRHQGLKILGWTSLILLYQLMANGMFEHGASQIKPVWQLHLLALVLGSVHARIDQRKEIVLYNVT